MVVQGANYQDTTMVRSNCLYIPLTFQWPGVSGGYGLEPQL